SLRMNMDSELADWMQITNALSYTSSLLSAGNNPGFRLGGQAQFAYGGNKTVYPYARLRHDDGSPALLYLDNNEAYVRDMQAVGLDWSYSPIDDMMRQRAESRIRDVLLNSGIRVSPLEGLHISLLYQFQDQVADRSAIYGHD